MSRRSIGADDQPGTKVAPQLPPPHFKCAGSGKLIIVKVRVNEQCLHEYQKKGEPKPALPEIQLT
ncbi:MAG: hypothetical protein Ct9H300mP7_3220 [Verrucomicrobiota bacterium]|nr:MAG: hypothetical protein Ct9H300mP7_3220 [Verrucomicrobiota bacterium]